MLSEVVWVNANQDIRFFFCDRISKESSLTEFVSCPYLNPIIFFCFQLFQQQFLTEILRWRALTTPDHILYTMLNSRVSFIRKDQVTGEEQNLKNLSIL